MAHGGGEALAVLSLTWPYARTQPLKPARMDCRTGAPIAAKTSCCVLLGEKTRSNVKCWGCAAAPASAAGSGATVRSVPSAPTCVHPSNSSASSRPTASPSGAWSGRTRHTTITASRLDLTEGDEDNILGDTEDTDSRSREANWKEGAEDGAGVLARAGVGVRGAVIKYGAIAYCALTPMRGVLGTWDSSVCKLCSVRGSMRGEVARGFRLLPPGENIPRERGSTRDVTSSARESNRSCTRRGPSALFYRYAP